MIYWKIVGTKRIRQLLPVRFAISGLKSHRLLPSSLPLKELPFQPSIRRNLV